MPQRNRGSFGPWGDTAGAIDEVTAVMERIVTVDDLLALIDAADGALTAHHPIDTRPVTSPSSPPRTAPRCPDRVAPTTSPSRQVLNQYVEFWF